MLDTRRVLLVSLAALWLAGCIGELEKKFIPDGLVSIDEIKASDPGPRPDIPDTGANPDLPVVPACEGAPDCRIHGICAGLTVVSCENGEWRCDYAAVEGMESGDETSCDGKDNDCDGATDEGITRLEDSDCKTKGVCGAEGAKVAATCVNGAWTCDYAGVPDYEGGAERSCDDKDNDCDGVTDEEIAVVNGSGCPNLGVCEGLNVARCAEGAWTCDLSAVLDYEPGAETSCDSKDNDCDGLTDEGIAGVDAALCPDEGVCSGADATLCKDGAMACDFSKIDGYEPGAETSCDSRDNDCDSLTDEEITEVPNLDCTGPGVCVAGGKAICGATGPECDYGAIEDYESGDETLCDEKDNDCDGLTDEDILVEDAAGCLDKGVCAGATVKKRCIKKLMVCDYALVPGYEVVEESCDNLDNDCDDFTDEDLLQTGTLGCKTSGVCESGVVGTCENGEWKCSYTFVPGYEEVEESCDNLDNDCNGFTDTNITDLARSDCKKVGVCTQGVTALCSKGSWICGYTQVPGYEEVEQSCDNLDNDCDDFTDEGITTLASSTCLQTGVCSAGAKAACVAGNWICDYAQVPGYQGVNELVCDSLDNNCDGDTDEGTCGLGKPCTSGLQCTTPVCKPAVAGGQKFCVNDVNDCITQLPGGDAQIDPNTTQGCMPGKPNQLASCVDGVWQPGNLCQGLTPVCASGTCKACIPDEVFCSGNQLLQCDATGDSSSVQQTCGAGTSCFADGFCAVDGERILNLTTIDTQKEPALAVLSDDSVAAFWSSRTTPGNEDPSGFAVVGRFLAPDGSADPSHPLEIVANTHILGNQRRPRVAANSSDTVFVVWQSKNQDGTSTDAVAGRLWGADRKPLQQSDFLVSQTPEGNQSQPDISALKNGGFAVAWQSDQQDGDLGAIVARIYLADGSPLADEFIVNTTTTSIQATPSVTGLADGNFVVAWESFNQDQPTGFNFGVYGQVFSSTGVKVGAEFRINGFTPNNQQNVSCASTSNASFICVWSSDKQDANTPGIYGQRFANDGQKLGAELKINSVGLGAQIKPTAFSLKPAGFGVAWESDLDTGLGVYVRTFGSAGNPLADDDQLNTTFSGDQLDVRCAGFSRGHMICAWTSDLQDGAGGAAVYLFRDPAP